MPSASLLRLYGFKSQPRDNHWYRQPLCSNYHVALLLEVHQFILHCEIYCRGVDAVLHLKVIIGFYSCIQSFMLVVC